MNTNESILDEIIHHKRREVEERKELHSVKLLEKSTYFQTECLSLVSYLQRPDLVGIIAEFKRRSPSKGVINEFAAVEEISLGYMQAGASALSILTDSRYFGGNNDDLTKARRINLCPILRKEFIVDEYQVIEAKSIGADVILLLANVLSDAELTQLSGLASSLGMEVLLETHTDQEIERANALDVGLVGINSRNLHDFSVSVERAMELVSSVTKEKTAVAESGIYDADTVVRLKRAGFSGFLIGDAFMREAKPDVACARLINAVKGLEGYVAAV